MGKQSAAQVLAVLITVALFGGTYYFAVIRPAATTEPAETSWTTLATGSPAAGEPGSPEQQFFPSPDALPAESAGNWTHTIRKCHDPEIGEFYTNAASCEGADPHNRISVAEPLNITPAQNRYSGQNYTAPAQDAGNSRTYRQPTQSAQAQKPNLRLHGKSPPPGLPPECKFPVGKALEIERDLAAADNPYKSTWRESYCKFRCEVIEDDCPVSDDDFYYRFRSMCPGTEHYNCYRPS